MNGAIWWVRRDARLGDNSALAAAAAAGPVTAVFLVEPALTAQGPRRAGGWAGPWPRWTPTCARGAAR